MDLLKKIFPMAFTLKTDFATLVVDIIIHFFVAFGIFIAGDLMVSLGIFGIIMYVISRIADIYVIISAVISVLHYFKVFK